MRPAITALLAGALLTLALAAPLSAWKAPTIDGYRRFKAIDAQEDKYYNYDDESQSAAWDNVDWMVTAIYGGNAHWTKIRDMYSSWGANLNMYLYDGTNWLWRANGGGKTLGLTTTAHVRAYGFTSYIDSLGRQSYRSYNQMWGYYLVATAHYDINEFGIDPDYTYFGYSEDADSEHAQRAQNYGYTATKDVYWLDNWDMEVPDLRVEDYYGVGPHHVWQSNGAATYIAM